MEPLAALALACNVTQIVEQAIAVGKTIYQIHKDGSTTANIELQRYVKTLQEGNSQLQRSLGQPSPQQLTDAEKKLKEITLQCFEIARELISKLDKLKSHGGKRDALGKAVQNIWHKSDIEELVKKLQDYQKLLESITVFAIRDKLNLLASMDKARFDQIDDHLKDFLDRLNDKSIWLHAEMQDNKRLLEKKLNQNAAHVDQGLATRLDDQLQREGLAQAKKQLCESLDFTERNWRVLEIARAKRRGTSWPFSDDPKQSSWSRLPEWLADSVPIFWIHGKPGSGKSTLMRYLWRHERTSQLLQTRKPQSKPFILTHAFWRPSQSEMEKSFRGMLCSLLYDTLVADDELLTSIVLSFPRLKKMRKIEDWDMEDDLVVVLRHAIATKASRSPVCIFLDGLDEIMEEKQDHDAVMEWIEDLSSSGLVKLCVSSRYVTPWIHRLGDAPQLRLQDLNRDDIKLFVVNSLESQIRNGLLSRREDAHTNQKDSFLEEVVQRADGVFLWAVLAMHNILDTKSATWKDLRIRLGELPIELAPFFKEILQRRGLNSRRDKEEATTYFKLCLDGGLQGPIYGDRDPYLHHAVVLRAMFHSSSPCKRYDRQYQDFRLECLDTRDRIENLCAGLIILEPAGYLRDRDFSRIMRGHDPDDSSGSGPSKDVDSFTQLLDRPFTRQFTADEDPKKMRAIKLRFYHRTVMDYLREDEDGKAVLQSYALTSEHVLRAYVEANLVRYKLRIRHHEVKAIASIFKGIVYYRSNHAQTITSSCVASVTADVIRTVSQTLETRSPLDGLLYPDEYSENPNIFGLFRAYSGRECAIDLVGLSLECGCSEYFQEHIGPYVVPGGMNGRVLTTQYQDYLLICAVEGDLPDIAIQLVNSGASIYTPMGAPRRICAASKLLASSCATRDRHRWQNVVERCSPQPCHILLGACFLGRAVHLSTGTSLQCENFAFAIDVGQIVPLYFGGKVARSSAMSGDEEHIGVVVITPDKPRGEAFVQVVAPLTFESFMRILDLNSTVNAEIEPQLRTAILKGVALEFLFRSYLDREHQKQLDEKMREKPLEEWSDKPKAIRLPFARLPFARDTGVQEALDQHCKRLGFSVDPDDPVLLKGPIRRFEEVQIPSAGQSEGGINRDVGIHRSDTESFSLPERSSTLYFDAQESMELEDRR